MKRNHLIITLLFFISSIPIAQAKENLPPPFKVIPQLQDVELLTGRGVDFGELKTLVLEGDFKRPVIGAMLSQLNESGNRKGTLTLQLDSTGTAPESAEGYILTISKGEVKIVSRGEAGLFYGCQTLEQLLEDAHDYSKSIPSCKIIDTPKLSYRAVHFDVKHHLDHMNYYYESVDRLARYKINAIIFEFEDKLRYQRQPLIGAPQAISIDEMAALTQYARERHIEISPLVQGLGHATFILKHEEYAYLRELPYNRWAFCPLHEGTYQVLFDLYRDAMEATPGSKYLHIGGDEIGNIGLCPRCKPTADKEGTISLNLYWLKRVCEFAEKNGRIPIFWDDMPLKEAGVYHTTGLKYDYTQKEVSEIWEKGEPKLEQLIKEFPKNCVYMRWNYSMASQPGNILALDWYRKHGLKAMAATAAQCGHSALFPYDERDLGMKSHGIPAIQSFIELAAEKNIDGMLCTAWDDRSPHMETYWRGFIASAEYSWSPQRRTLEEYDQAYLQREYGESIPDYASFYGKLREAAIFWEKTFYKNGSRLDIENALFNLPGLAHWLPPKEPGTPLKTDFTDLLIELPDKKDPGSWRIQYAERLEEAKTVMTEYTQTSKLLDEFYKNAKRNRYHWKVFSALNDFQVTAPGLMLALEQSDTDDHIKRKAGLEAINKALNDFNMAWYNLTNVYSETRFITYPPNYVPDRYFHFASQREDLSWMIQTEQLLQQKVNDWIND